MKKLKKDNATEEEIQNAGICRKICYPRIKNVINGWFKDKNPPPEKKQIKSNLKYFKIDFVDTEHADPTDKQMKKLVEQCTEMLCLKENCFDEIEKTRTYSIFKNHEKYLGIVYDDDGIEPLKKQIKAVGKEFSVYVFSLDDSKHEEEFEDVIDLVELNPIPSSIVSVYSKIWRRL